MHIICAICLELALNLFQDEDDYNQPPILGRKYTAPLNAFNDLAKEDKVCKMC